MQFLNLEKPYKNKLPWRRNQLQRKKKSDADNKDHYFRTKTYFQFERKKFFGKATTKYVIELKTASLLVVCWGRMGEEIFYQILFLYQTLKGGGKESFLTQFRTTLFFSMIISTSYIHLQHTQSSRYSLRIQGEFYVLLETGLPSSADTQGYKYTTVCALAELLFCKELTCVVSHIF